MAPTTDIRHSVRPRLSLAGVLALAATAMVALPAGAEAAVEWNQTRSPDPVRKGDQLTQTITVRNTGGTVVPDVRIYAFMGHPFRMLGTMNEYRSVSASAPAALQASTRAARRTATGQIAGSGACRRGRARG